MQPTTLKGKVFDAGIGKRCTTKTLREESGIPIGHDRRRWKYVPYLDDCIQETHFCGSAYF
ncbi:Uncharacterised protein [Mycobacterium tuberculosis]|nr:Uncharacterised protein [Mycobacterium tuberculosis]